MPDHTAPCKEMRTIETELAVLTQALTDHISFDKEFQKEQHEFNIASTKAREALREEMHDMETRIGKDIRAAFKEHESVEAAMADKAARRVTFSIDKLSKNVEKMKSDSRSVERSVLLWIIGIMTSGIGVLIFHILTGGY